MINSQTTNAKIVIGIDPGYDRVGWAIGRKQRHQVSVLDYGCLQTKKDDQLLDRYRQILQALEKLVLKHQVEICAIENLFFGQYKTTANKVAEARGLILALMLQHQIEIQEFTPQQLKVAASGDGHADKRAMEKMVRMQLNLPPEKIMDDTIDALGLLLATNL